MKVHTGGELFQNFLIHFHLLLCIFYSMLMIVDYFAGALWLTSGSLGMSGDEKNSIEKYVWEMRDLKNIKYVIDS